MTSKQSRGQDRPFPWRCPDCGEKKVEPVTIPYTAKASHDGTVYSIEIPKLTVPRCQACGKLVFDCAADDQIWQALRALLRLLTPRQIRDGREALGSSQKELASRLGVANETISRWETGAMIQSRAMDNLLRIYFAFPDVRSALRGADQSPDLGTTVASPT